MHTYKFLDCLLVLLIVDIKYVHLEELSESKGLGDKLLEKMIEINLNVQKTLERLDKKIDIGKQRNSSVLSRLLTSERRELLVEDLETDGWEMIFRATSCNGQNVYKAWTTGVSTCFDKPTSMERSYSSHYRNNIVSNWANIGVKYVKYAFYKNNKEVAYVKFNATGSNINSWFDKSRVLASSYTDLTATSVYNIFSTAGYHIAGNLERRFHINKAYGGCDVDIGHMVVSEEIPPKKGCFWDIHPTYPQFLYSKINSVDVWNRRMFGRADYMAIFINI